MSFEMIPDELKALKQWVCWQAVERDGRTTKLPIDPHTGRLASTNDASTWAAFDVAVEASKSFSGIGFVFTRDDPYCGIDMDGHIDIELARYIGSYTETSQSGNGAHIIVRASLPVSGRRNKDYEIYDSGRYFVMTGKPFADLTEIIDNQDAVDQMLDHVFGIHPKHDDPPRFNERSESDADLVERIQASAQGGKFSALWAGDVSGYTSHSDADMALLGMLRFWTGGDKVRSFSLFADSGLMRKKWEREDYRERTWAAVDHGEVLEDIASSVLAEMDAEAASYREPLPTSMREADLAPWRKVSLADVEQALRGSLLDDVIQIFRTPCADPLPYAIGLAKALPFMGALMCGERTDLPVSVLSTYRGIDRARIRILSADGQTMNIWCMLVSGSGTGKDIGRLVPKVLAGRGLLIGSAGSEEGIADALAERGNGMISISEFANWIDQKHWQHKAASFLTGAFNDGWFRHSMSRRGKEGAPAREAMYCYPSIIANIQPETLASLARVGDITTGFLGRFLVIHHDDDAWIPYPKSGYDSDRWVARLNYIADYLTSITGEVSPPGDFYARELMEMFVAYKAGLRPLWTRIANEYYLRIALMIDLRLGEPMPDRISDEALARSSVVCQWLFAGAEKLLGDAQECERSTRYERGLNRVLEIVKQKGCEGVSMSQIHMLYGKGADVKERRQFVEELESRGLVKVERKGKGITVRMA